MKILFNKKFLEHNVTSEAEGAYRIDEFRDIEDSNFDGEGFITLVHPENYKQKIKDACMQEGIVAEVQLNQASWEAACLAVGLTVKASETGDFAVVRPPGHHAGFETPTGFCFFNNIAIAAQKLVNEGKRVLIIDVDGHHGNGTQEIFYESNRVMFISFHEEYTFPFTGFILEQGEGEGLGFNYNFPLLKGSGDKVFFERFCKALVKAREFQPDVIGVSAGFDAYEGDRMLNLNLSADIFYEMAYRLKKSFKHTPVFAVLEGGYHRDVRKLVDSFVEGINNGGKPPAISYDTDMSIG